MTRLFLTTLETRHFTFEGVGATAQELQATLARMLRAYCKDNPDADLDYLLRTAEDAGMGTRTLEAGKAYMEGGEFVMPAMPARKRRRATAHDMDTVVSTSTTGDTHTGCGGVWRQDTASNLIDVCDKCGEERA